MATDTVQENWKKEGAEENQYLVFTLKSQRFGLQAVRVLEISSVLGTTPVPGAPPYIEGILNLRGRLATVINFRKKFSFEPKEHDEDTRIIIVEHGGFPIGILVDSVEEVIEIPDEKVQRLPKSATTPVSEQYVAGVGVLDSRLIILLNAEKVLSQTELLDAAAISELQGKARKTQGETEKDRIEAEQQPPGETQA
ncbi:chemotaxis protein CheW [Acidobacteriia bacterium AH_259_A11_L15]|nr:chemotaxis protein CheW [Acidobacteriia bacterium AH_259_A11_L15]